MSLRRLLPLAFALLFALAVSPAQASWAIALAKGGNPHVAGGVQSVELAKERALEECNKTGPSPCKIMLTGRTYCAAMANNGADWGFGSDASPRVASKKALARCTALKRGTCKVVHNFCGP